MPPELAVVSQKRLRSGRLTEDQLLDVLERYQPGVIAVIDQPGPAWSAFLEQHYAPPRHIGGRWFYVASPIE
jgi:hypothetical protein